MADRLKILIIRAGALGDTLMLMPLIRALSEDNQIIILGRKPGIDYLEPYVKQCINIERGGWHRLFGRDSNIDISCPQVDRIVAFINDKENIVSENILHMFPDSKIKIFPPFPDPDLKTHVAIHMLKSLQSAGIPVDPQTAFDETTNRPVMKSKRVTGKKIVFHPGSGSKKKNYSPEFWLDLSTRLKKENPDPSIEICFLLGPSEEDFSPLVERKAEAYGSEIVICPNKKKLLSILNRACLYIGHDSGVTHLAAMLGVNTIALFKSSSIDQWRPLGPSVKVIEAGSNEKDILEKVAGEAISFIK